MLSSLVRSIKRYYPQGAKSQMNDSWNSSDLYEQFMGRWSSMAARSFLAWLSPSSGMSWLDVGCGSGALSATIANSYSPKALTAIDQSPAFVRATQSRLGGNAQCAVGNALALPVPDAVVDHTVSGLVLNFIMDPTKALGEMRRVTVAGGTVAIYIWDYTGTMQFLSYFWDAAAELDPRASILHEGNRFPNSTAEALESYFRQTGFSEMATQPIMIETRFLTLDDYWQPFLSGQGPAPTYVQSLSPAAQERLHGLLADQLPIRPDGSISLLARAWAVKGRV